MLFQPGTRLQTGMTAEIIGDDEEVAFGIVGFDVGQKRDVACRVARSSTAGQLFAIAHTQRPVHPGLLRTPAIVQQRFDTVPIGGPAGAGSKVRGTTGPSSSVQTGNGKIYRFPASCKGEHAIRFIRKIVLSAST